MEKKKALKKAAVSKPKGNGINDGYVRWECPAPVGRAGFMP